MESIKHNFNADNRKNLLSDRLFEDKAKVRNGGVEVFVAYPMRSWEHIKE